MPRTKNLTRTITIELHGSTRIDFEALLGDLEAAMESYANGGRDLDWDITAEA